MTFKEHPTLDDLQSFAAEQDALRARLRQACKRSYDAEAEGRRLSDRYSQSVARKFKRVDAVGDGRDLAAHAQSSSVARRAKELYAEAAEAELEVTEIQRLIEAGRVGRQMEAYDYDLYLSAGLELPPHRRDAYERNAYAYQHAPELLNAYEAARDFLSVLSGEFVSD